MTAAGLLGALIAALYLLERPAFAAIVAAIVALGGYEWARLAVSARRAAHLYALACLALFAGLEWWLHPLGPGSRPLAGILGASALFWIFVVPWWLARGIGPAPNRWLLAAGLAVLLPAALAMAVLSPARLLMLLGLVWIADTAAYFAGRAFGRRRLAPVISPAKTWEGAAGAAAACIIYAIICAMLDPGLAARVQGAAWAPYLGGTVLLCALGITGDLFESAAKRQAGVKDSGALLPGHGGVLDRIDSATAVLPLGALLMQLIGTT